MPLSNDGRENQLWTDAPVGIEKSLPSDEPDAPSGQKPAYEAPDPEWYPQLQSDENEPRSGFSLDLLSFGDLENIPDLEWHVNGFFPKGGVTMIYGPPGSGKSFVAMALILALDHGERWLGHPVEDRCRSLYVALEGQSGLKMRSQAWHTHFDKDINESRSKIQTGHINLAEYQHTNAISEAVREHDIEFVMFDTLARSTSGMEENSAKDMGHVIREIDRIRENTEASVSFVHHTGVSETHRPRGSSALIGAVDSSIMVKAGTVSSQKLKDFGSTGEPEPIRFKLESVDQSAVAVPASEPTGDSSDIREDALRNDLDRIVEALKKEGRPISKSSVQRLVGANRTRISGSIDVWTERGFLTTTLSGQSKLVSLGEWH